MPLHHKEIAVADAAVGDNLLNDTDWAKSQGYWRTLKKVALTGGNAAGECKIDVKISSTIVVDDMTNSSTGTLTDWLGESYPVNRAIPPNAHLSAKVVSAPTVSPIHIYMQIDRRRTRRPRYSRRPD
jgi:hypothetical protein